MCLQIKDKLEAFFKQQPEASKTDELRRNVRAHLANRLTEGYEKFQVFQKMFNSILYENARKNKDKEKDKYKEPVSTSDNTGTQNMLVVLDEGQETMLQERSLEIEQVITDTLDLHSLLQQIQLMTVQQGSLLDRIDVNLDKTRQNLDKTLIRLERTAQSFSTHQKRLILFFITLAIFVTSLLILSK